ncbi:MAG: hypothetical protein M1399_00645 [Actinobacteria bacterium]|nr:hypothetical protein [Actinomycetota bacterium]MCL5446234.1 hypothetical protein [Actinomycetota bacterium]
MHITHSGIPHLGAGVYVRFAIAIVLSVAIVVVAARLSRPIPALMLAPAYTNGMTPRYPAALDVTTVPHDPQLRSNMAKEPHMSASAPASDAPAGTSTDPSATTSEGAPYNAALRPAPMFFSTNTIQGLPWPQSGGAAIGIPGPNVIMSHGQLRSVPIASLTKMMTAYVILQDHPLTPGWSGPTIRIDSVDVDITYNDELNDETMVPVARGELLTEKQALEGLLVHSACNLAYALARWDSGSVSVFVAKMNATARKLGLDSTRYAGPAGFSPASVSTPADLIKLATVAMSIPAFAQIVDHPTVDLPVAGTLYNYVSAIGQNGVIGIKSGFNYQSQGCVVLAATRYVDNRPALLIAAVTGQGGMDPLGSAQAGALALIDSLPARLHRQRVVSKGQAIMHAVLMAPWLPHGRVRYDTFAGESTSMLEWPGASPAISVHFVKRSYACRTTRINTDTGTITVRMGALTRSVPLVLRRAPRMPQCPSLLWRLIHA